jgi:hypothetical protein
MLLLLLLPSLLAGIPHRISPGTASFPSLCSAPFLLDPLSAQAALLA